MNKPGKRKVFWLVLLALVFLFFVATLAVCETYLRFIGVRPYVARSLPVRRVEPGGKLYQKDPVLGYTNRPGRLKVIYPTGLAVRFTNLPNHRRITRPLERYTPDAFAGKPGVWFFGASFTYGDGLNDEETFAWLLQKRFPQFDITNFAVNGYSTLNSLLQFQQALKTRKKPRLAVLFYANFHDRRNTGLRFWQKILVPTNFLGVKTLPRARLTGNNSLQISAQPLGYQEFPLMRHSSLAHFLEIQYNRMESSFYRSRRVTEVIIETMAKTAREENVKFVVATLLNDLPMVKFLHSKGIPVIDIYVDFWQPGYNNLPHDVHPSPLTNRIYANRMERILRFETGD